MRELKKMLKINNQKISIIFFNIDRNNNITTGNISFIQIMGLMLNNHSNSNDMNDNNQVVLVIAEKLLLQLLQQQ